MKKLILYIFCFGILLAPASSQKIKNQWYKPAPGKPKNIILLIGDGMGLSQITAGLIKNKGKLNLERFSHTGFIKTWAADDLVTESAAGATAFATGQKTKNGYISVDVNGKPLKTLIEWAEEKGMVTGMVVTSSITHATPAAFVAHNISRKNHEEIALDFLKLDVEVLIGGGKKYFEKRKDGRNLLDEMHKKGYEIEDKEKRAGKYNNEKVLALVADDHLFGAKYRKDFLPKASLNAAQLLTGANRGFFLMIEGSQIDFGGHDNNADYMMEEMVDFDNTIGKLMDMYGKDPETLIIVVADHETGGFAINGGNLKEGTVNGAWTTKEHTASLIPVFANGPGAEQFSGIYDNTDIFKKIVQYIENR